MPHVAAIVALLGSALGLLFSSVSTYDFVAHLDRQVHGLHCSFLPGMTAPDVSGASGCHATLMSPYSSVLRESIWGGIPISLPSMATFAFLLFVGLFVTLTGRERDARATGFYAAAALLPLGASLIMGAIAITQLDAFCKLCVGIYVASALSAFGALALYRRARRTQPAPAAPAAPAALGVRAPLSTTALALGALVGCLFVGTSTLAYALSAPDFSRFAAGCGELPKRGDAGALLTLGPPSAGAASLIEVLDPLCPACRAFERRFTRIPAADVRRSVALFPLDNSCNWMVDRAIHPGACAISEALLCAGDSAEAVLAWAFDNQEEIVAGEQARAGSAKERVVAHFPSLAGCVGSSKARARLNRALRWAVDNRLPVLTPQLYVNGKRLCDADTDLGLDYTLTRMLGGR